MTVEQPYGTWKSPITAHHVTSNSIRFGDIVLEGQDTYWSESRPEEGGRYVIVRRSPEGVLTDINPPPFNSRTRVHEYGGGAFTVVDDAVYFVNYADQRLYAVSAETEPVAFTPKDDIRHASFARDRNRNRLIAVREDHSQSSTEPENTIAALDLESDSPKNSRVLLNGYDFFAMPRINPDGSRLAWLCWNHPNMPWDGTELWIGTFDERGDVVDRTMIAGGPTESIFQPEWSPTGELHFVSDRTGWWNIYRWDQRGSVNLTPVPAEYGVPLWKLGMSTYGFAADGTLVAASTRNGQWSLAKHRSGSSKEIQIPLPSTVIGTVTVGTNVATFEAASPVEPAAIVTVDLETDRISVLARSSLVEIDRAYLSVPGAITFPTTQNSEAYGYFHPPQNKDFTAPQSELPPLIVISHGGPTGSADTGLDLKLQYWTSRGFAVLDVNYRGSTGYGTPFRRSLDGNWGIADVDDCIAGAAHLVGEGLVDGNRLAIRGWSASGFTTLAALAFHDVFHAGASHYGISDLEAMTQDTHKFESRYLDTLLGPYPESRGLYRQRSPINAVDQLCCPLILFQGVEDKVVPPNQAQMMFDAVNEKGIKVALVMFEGEQHGFRKAVNIRRSLEAELYFLSQVFGFEPADRIEPVDIANA